MGHNNVTLTVLGLTDDEAYALANELIGFIRTQMPNPVHGTGWSCQVFNGWPRQ